MKCVRVLQFRTLAFLAVLLFAVGFSPLEAQFLATWMEDGESLLPDGTYVGSGGVEVAVRRGAIIRVKGDPRTLGKEIHGPALDASSPKLADKSTAKLADKSTPKLADKSTPKLADVERAGPSDDFIIVRVVDRRESGEEKLHLLTEEGYALTLPDGRYAGADGTAFIVKNGVPTAPLPPGVD